MRETELKLSVPSWFQVPDDPDLLPGVALVTELPAQDLRAVYHDTPDLRLARWGVTLRHRSGEGRDGWDLKMPVEGSAATREELHVPGAPDEIPGELADLITALVRTATVGPVAVLQTRRRRWALRDGSGHELAILCDDEVSVLEGHQIAGGFREIELERRDGRLRDLQRILAVLGAGGGGRSQQVPKLVRALGSPAEAPPDLVPTNEIDPDAEGREAIRASLAAGAARIVSHDRLARRGEDPEGVHQVRVGSRRIRSDLRTFAPLLDPDWTAPLVDDLRWLRTSLGDVRDLDVQLAQLEMMAADLRPDLDPLFDSLSQDRLRARERMLATLRSDRYKRLLDRLVDAVEDPGTTDGAAKPSRVALPPLVASMWERLARRGREADRASPEEQLHGIRIRAKRARYAAEAVAPALGDRRKDAERFVLRAKRLQDVLGDLQDAVVARTTILRAVERGGRDQRFDLAAGRLLERVHRAGEEARDRFPDTWKKLDRKKVTGWLTSGG